MLVLLVTARVALADAPSHRQAEEAAQRWMESGEAAIATSVDPFLFDHDGKGCKKAKKAKELVECTLADDELYPIRNWSPSRLRVHRDATFATWQRDRKHDVIERHRRELAKLENHAFVHFDARGAGGTSEIVLAVKLDDAGQPVIDTYLVSFLPEPAHPIGEAGARALASSWVSGMANSDDSVQRSNAHRTGYPFTMIGLPVSQNLDCATEMHAQSSKQFLQLALCVAAAKQGDLLARLPRSKWEVLDDPADVRTRADKDQDHLGAALPMLDRMASDHVLLFNRIADEDAHFELVLVIRNDADHPVVDAVIANLY